MIEDDQGALVPVPLEAYGNDQARQIFVEALQNVKDAASKALGEGAAIDALCIPDYLDGQSKTILFNKAKEIGLRIHRPWQIIQWLNAARLAYGLDSCHAFGLNQKDCDIDEGPHQVVYVDYQPDSLELKVADVTEYGAFPLHHARVSLALDDEHILSKIGNALTNLSQSSVFAEIPPQYGRFEFLRAIVVGGEASQPLMEELHSALVEAFPGQESKIGDSIHPLYVGAVGAASKARYFMLHPEALEDIQTCPGHGAGVEHDEL